jgi:Tol biopolymer transport system component
VLNRPERSPTCALHETRHRLAPILGALVAAGVICVAALAAPAGAKTFGENGQILYAHNDPSLPDSMITTVNPDGSDANPLVLGECPHWSPNGSVIASCGAPDGNATQLINPDTASLIELAPPDLSLFLACSVWSPDGGRLACDQFNHTADPDRDGIYTIRSSDGGDLQRVTSNPGGEDIPGDYSPDGTRIVFMRVDPHRPTEASRALFVVNVNGSDLHQITPWGLVARGGDPGSSWSPNGGWILFGGGGRVYVVHPDGTGLRTITLASAGKPALALGPSWSPDGTKMVFALLNPRTGQEGIYTANADGSGLQQVTRPATNQGQFDDSPDWGTHPVTG